MEHIEARLPYTDTWWKARLVGAFMSEPDGSVIVAWTDSRPEAPELGSFEVLSLENVRLQLLGMDAGVS